MKPSLRFPEFKDEWQEKRLGDVFYFKKTNSLSRADFTEKGSISNIHYGDIHTKLPAYLDTRSYQLPKIVSIGKGIGEFVEVGDLSMADASENYTDIGKSVEIVNICDKEKVVSGLHTLLLSPKEKHAIGFLGQYFQNGIIRKKIRKVANGISVLGISKNDLSKLTLLTPCIKEQEKITDFLRGGDERMVLLEKKVDAMREYKKGVMSAIFSGKLRFKDEKGNPYPDWEEKRLGELLKERKEYARKDGRYEHISLTKDGIVPKSDRYERDFLVGSDDKKYRITRVNDICYNPANLKFGVIARNKYKNGIFSPIYVTYEVKGADAVFMEYYLTRWDFINYVRRYEEGTVYERMAVGPEDFARLMIKLPCLAEQRKIADFLSAIDRKIELEQTRLDRTKDFKKGLLQRMFV